MDDAKSFLLGIMQTLRERFGNPFISSFLIAWPIWNFRLILVLIGNSKDGVNSWAEKINYIDERLMPIWWQWPLHGGLIPAFFALAWIFILPPYLQYVRKRHEKNVNAAETELYAISETKTLTIEQANEMRAVFVKQRAEWASERFEVLKSLDDLVKANELYVTQADGYKRQIQELTSTLYKLENPPPPPPTPITSLKPDERARHLGIHFDVTPIASEIVFDGRAIRWPWRVSVSNSGLPQSLDGAILPQQVVKAMFLIPPDRAMSFAEWITHFGENGIHAPTEVFNYLIDLSLFNIQSGHSTPNHNATQARYRLAELGFEIR